MKSKNQNKKSTKQNSSSQAQALVLAKPKNRDKNSKQKKNVKKIQQILDPKANPFLNALVHPFDPKSLGCQVPDPFPFPTATYHLHQTLSLTSSGGGSGSLVLLPNPILSTIDIPGFLNGTANGIIYSTPQTPYSTTLSDGRAYLYGATNPSSLATIFSTFRVVSWGIKISNLQPELSATGRIMVAMIPLGDTVPSYNTLHSLPITLGSTELNCIFGTSINVLGSSALLELPTCLELAVQDLLHGDLEISGMYTNMNFWSFKNTSILGGNTSNVIGDEVVINGLNVVTSIGYKDDTRCVGGCGIAIYYEGLPPNATGFQIEIIYHLEGQPQQAPNTTVNVPVPSNRIRPLVGSTTQVERAMTSASLIDNVYSFIKSGAQFLDDNKSSLLKGLSMLSGFI